MDVPLILAGPVLRHANPGEICLWLATSTPSALTLRLYADGSPLLDRRLSGDEHRRIQVGRRCHINLLHLRLDQRLDEGCRLDYDILLGESEAARPLEALLEDLLYPGRRRPGFHPREHLRHVLHGSCRKPHGDGPDALLEVDRLLAGSGGKPEAWPDLLMFTGDQVYADDVAGPMLQAIHQLIAALGLYDEQWEGASLSDSQALYACPQCYYQRENLLPRNKANRPLLELFFRGARKPIFTSVSAHNHLITLAEVLALYLLSWSPACWRLVDLDRDRHRVPARFQDKYQRERQAVEAFVAELPAVRRVLAHVPVYMAFDDHDITDDWNLNRGWEEVAYSHPFSRRIIGNALLAYWLCQGWGNQPGNFHELEQGLERHFTADGLREHAALIDRLLAWQHWHFRLNTQPPLIVLDTRTRRWRSESSPASPSGLMDWESLSELQQQLLGETAVILVSPAPVFGVKLIEAIQRVFSFFGRALLVDAENWMAHPGSAHVLLNIFLHPRTPPRFIILSGDVHYSFAYDVSLRHRQHGPRILQFTASGLKNRFPERLLRKLAHGNAWLYGSRSPLNWFTKRRRLRIHRRHPDRGGTAALYNGHAIGQLLLEPGGEARTRLLTPRGTVEFLAGAPEDEAWDERAPDERA